MLVKENKRIYMFFTPGALMKMKNKHTRPVLSLLTCHQDQICGRIGVLVIELCKCVIFVCVVGDICKRDNIRRPGGGPHG